MPRHQPESSRRSSTTWTTRHFSRDEILLWLGHEWVQHPDGYSVFVPKGAEAFFELIAPAIRRDPVAFLGSPMGAGDLCECLDEGELARIADWLDALVRDHGEGMGAHGWGPSLPLYGWAMAMNWTVLNRLEGRRFIRGAPRARQAYANPNLWIEVRLTHQSPEFVSVPAEARALVKFILPAFRQPRESDPDDRSDGGQSADWWLGRLSDGHLAEVAHWLRGYFAWVDARSEREVDIEEIRSWADEMVGAAEAEFEGEWHAKTPRWHLLAARPSITGFATIYHRT